MNWIKCSDRMPEVEENVLIFSPEEGILFAYRSGTHNCWNLAQLDPSDYHFMWFNKITHWMPLPNGPEEK